MRRCISIQRLFSRLCCFTGPRSKKRRWGKNFRIEIQEDRREIKYIFQDKGCRALMAFFFLLKKNLLDFFLLPFIRVSSSHFLPLYCSHREKRSISISLTLPITFISNAWKGSRHAFICDFDSISYSYFHSIPFFFFFSYSFSSLSEHENSISFYLLLLLFFSHTLTSLNDPLLVRQKSRKHQV